jgi:hypothetical protein
MLLRANYLGSTRRTAFFQKHAPDAYVLANRPSFKKGRTDATEYAWLLWRGEPAATEERETGELHMLPAIPRGKRRK